MIKTKQLVFNELGVNSFILHDETRKCLIVDPGCNNTSQEQQLKRAIHDDGLQPEYIVLTHGHFDHVAGLAWAKAEFGCPVIMHREDLLLLQRAVDQAGLFGFSAGSPPEPDRFIEEGEVIAFGNSRVSVIHVPGHSPGSICLYAAGDNLLICGDVLFNGSIGRTDLFKGDHDLLISGIRKKLLNLPRETVVWPGHGPKTTIGSENDTNPFLS